MVILKIEINIGPVLNNVFSTAEVNHW